ncbi:hypothetical protein [Gemmatimonas sp.]
MAATKERGHRTTAKELRARCRSIREQLIGQQLATAEEIAAVWPGGESNYGLGMTGWIECYAQLTRFAGRLETSGAAQSAAQSAQLESVVRAASSRAPKPVVLSCGDYAVHPKSAHTLAFLDSLEAVQRPLVRLMVTRAQDETLEPGELDALLPMARSLAQRTWAWVLLSPGVGLPFEDNAQLVPPAWTEQLTPEDLLTIYFAHREIHAEAVAIMSAAIPHDGGPVQSRLSLSGFLTGYASEHGLPPSQLMRQWSLPESVAAALASAEAHRVADENAKAKRSERA